MLDSKDYDGDELNFIPAMDTYMKELFYPFSPHFTLMDLSRPLQICGDYAMTDSVVASTSEWITSERREYMKGL